MPAPAEAADPPDGRPRTAYGYIRTEEPNDIEIALQRKEIGAFCQVRGLVLGAVFVDRGVREDVTARTGFTALLDVLPFPDSYAVVVPTLGHLSGHENILRALTSRILGTATRLLAVYEDEEYGHE